MFKCIIMGAAGRDFHNFRSFFLDQPEFQVCAFTATQIPFIDQRSYPRELAGERYSADIPIHDERELEALIAEHGVDFVFFAYSDLSHQEVMHRAARVQAAGASFVLLGPRQTQLVSRRKVVAITATRTGAGKSPLTQFLAQGLTRAGVRVVTIRHPMPYGNLRAQAVQRFASFADLDHHECTIEEREEYEPYVRQGLVIYAGVDYRAVLAAAEEEADIILWDGGNNDFAFIRPDFNIVVCDALRAGHGLEYYPGETNFRAADLLVINKVAQAGPEAIQTILDLKARLNPEAELVQSDLEVTVEEPEVLTGARVLIIEDGPTVTHGGMPYGAGWVAAQHYRVGEVIDPRPHAVGSIADTFAANPHLQQVLPAMGYSREQREELRATIASCNAELVINASPAAMAALLGPDIPVVQVRYRWAQRSGDGILSTVKGLVDAS
jgi:predicted GTPase